MAATTLTLFTKASELSSLHLSSASLLPSSNPGVTENTPSYVIYIVIALSATVVFLVCSLLCLVCCCLCCCANQSGQVEDTDNKEEVDADHKYKNPSFKPAIQGTLLLPNKLQRVLLPFQGTSTRRRKIRQISRSELTSLSPKQRLHALEFPHEAICLLCELRETNFGKVYKGEVSRLLENESSTTVLIKSLRDSVVNDVKRQFNVEAVWTSGFDHPNILSLLAVSNQNPRYMIYEYMEFGTLKDFLLSTASLWLDLGAGMLTDETFTTSSSNEQVGGLEELLTLVLQVAEGMAYLANRGFVHKDLAARNCHIGQGLLVKIANFGLSYDIKSKDYCCIQSADSYPVPLRWLAPESLKSSQYSTFSDMWSYGVLVWEVFSLGDQPYAELSNAEAAQCILVHRTLPRPDYCPESVFSTMQLCWQTNPEKRPDFESVEQSLRGCITSLDVDNVSQRFSAMLPSTPELHRMAFP